MLSYIIGKLFNIFMELVNLISKKEGKYELSQKFELRFKQDGTFKIVQFTDLHEFKTKNENTIKLMAAVLEEEKPDLVLLTGDNIEGLFCRTKFYAKKAFDSIAVPMEKRKIPWAVVLGNHDSEFSSANRTDQMKLYMSYKYNLSQSKSAAIGRAGDYNILIKDSNGQVPIFNIFMMDSGDYCLTGYDYIKKSQIYWYEMVSNYLEKEFHKVIPSLMFFHMPLKQQKLVGKNGKYIGNRNERECVQSVDKGMFEVIKKMRNVKGVFCGHDHTNDYYGILDGITLGYGCLSGYNAPVEKGAKRGARVFVLEEKNLEKFDTYCKISEN